MLGSFLDILPNNVPCLVSIIRHFAAAGKAHSIASLAHARPADDKLALGSLCR